MQFERKSAATDGQRGMAAVRAGVGVLAGTCGCRHDAAMDSPQSPLLQPIVAEAPSPDPDPSPDPEPEMTRPAGVASSSVPGSRARYATAALGVGLLALGCVWRLIDLKYPRTFAFDEHHFVLNARNYLSGQPDWNDHPPLGKLLLMPTMRLFGDNGMGWRLPSALLGLVLVVLAGLVAGKIFESRRVGLLTAAFLATDGFFVSYARIALLDTPMTAFIYGALALMLWARSLWWFAGAAICVGLAVATKWTGVCVLLVAPWLLVRGKRRPWHAIWMFALASLVYVSVLVIALRITGQPISVSGLLGSNVSLLKHHAAFTVWDNAASSKWYTWPFLTHPILLFYEALDATLVRATTSLGNPLLWYATTASIAATAFALARGSWRALRAGRPWGSQSGRPSGGGALTVAAMLALILPFVITRRQSYIFHYLGTYGLGLGLLSSWLVKLEDRFAGAVTGFVALATAVSILYAPLWTNGLTSRTAFLARLPFPGWH